MEASLIILVQVIDDCLWGHFVKFQLLFSFALFELETLSFFIFNYSFKTIAGR